MPSSIETYTSRLQYTNKSVVTFFSTENSTQSKDLVNVLKTHGQKVPKELNQGNNERGRRLNAVPVRDDSHSPAPEGQNNNNRQQQFLNARGDMAASNSSDDEPTITPPSQQQQSQQQQAAQNAILSSTTRYNIRPNPVRRVRHAEVVLVDQCIVAYGRSWLRLRWPGSQGGFGGFVALSKVEDMIKLSGMDVNITKFKSEESVVEEVVVHEARGGDRVDPSSSSGVQPTSTTNTTTTIAATSTTETALLCQETNTHYPTSDVMKLMAVYDDGLNGTTPGVVEEEDGNNPMGMEDSMGSLENGDVSLSAASSCLYLGCSCRNRFLISPFDVLLKLN